MNRSDIYERLRRLSFIAFDFDGVFTDNRVIVSQNGHESVICCRSDGLGLKRLGEVNVDFLVISTETNPVVTERCKKLRIRCIQGVGNKLSVLRNEINIRGVNPDNTAYVGNDINDIDCLRFCGVPVIVADACDEIESLALLKLNKMGGRGAVREFCDLVWQAKIEVQG